jgi:hypothetical protein
VSVFQGHRQRVAVDGGAREREVQGRHTVGELDQEGALVEAASPVRHELLVMGAGQRPRVAARPVLVVGGQRGQVGPVERATPVQVTQPGGERVAEAVSVEQKGVADPLDRHSDHRTR